MRNNQTHSRPAGSGNFLLCLQVSFNHYPTFLSKRSNNDCGCHCPNKEWIWQLNKTVKLCLKQLPTKNLAHANALQLCWLLELRHITKIHLVRDFTGDPQKRRCAKISKIFFKGRDIILSWQHLVLLCYIMFWSLGSVLSFLQSYLAHCTLWLCKLRIKVCVYQCRASLF